MEINERISIIMEHYNMTPSEFAEKLDVQRSSISHITSGRNKPSLEFITKVKNNFPGIGWDWLINNVGPMIVPNGEKIKEDAEPKRVPLPDLFTLIEDEDFGKNVPNKILEEKLKAPKIDNFDTVQEKEILKDSQRLENISKPKQLNQKIVKRVILFFEDGSFESFEN